MSWEAAKGPAAISPRHTRWLVIKGGVLDGKGAQSPAEIVKLADLEPRRGACWPSWLVP